MTSHRNLLSPPTRLPDDPAADRIADGDDPAEVAAAFPRVVRAMGPHAPRRRCVTARRSRRTHSHVLEQPVFSKVTRGDGP
jgi:hypothetical protein